MKERLLVGMLLLATIMLGMYYSLIKTHPELLSGFIVLIGVGISHILNSAEDILASLFKIGESPKPDVPAGTIQTKTIILPAQKEATNEVTTTATPVV